MHQLNHSPLIGLSVLLACADPVTIPTEPALMDEEDLPSTTSGQLALLNLDFRIESAEQLLAASEDDAIRAELIALLSQRARFRGSFVDYDRADAESAALLAANPESHAALFSRASVLGGLHRFEEAHAVLSEIEGKEDLVLAARLPMWIAAAFAGPVVDQASARAQASPSFSTFVAKGSALAARGDFDEADRAFLDAAAAYRDVSPFAIAWLQFQRGVMWSERAGDSERGRHLYEDAVARLPKYVTASVHLAEIERETDRSAAIDRLRAIVHETSDPEPMGLLGELLVQAGQVEEGRMWIEEARTLYVNLLARHRAAFADHGAEFYLGVGEEPATALDLARDNLALRPTERAYSLAIRAALAAGVHSQACQWARDAELKTHTGVELTEDLPRGLSACR